MDIIANLCTEVLTEMTQLYHPHPPFSVLCLPCMSGMDFWYWSGSLQKMVKASLFNI